MFVGFVCEFFGDCKFVDLFGFFNMLLDFWIFGDFFGKCFFRFFMFFEDIVIVFYDFNVDCFV